MPLFQPKQLDVDALAAAIMTRIAADSNLKKQFWNLANSVQSFVTVPSTAGLVQDIAISSITGSGAVITWTAIGAATSYELEYKIKGDLYSVERIVGITGTTYTLTGLIAGTQYDVQVKAVI